MTTTEARVSTQAKRSPPSTTKKPAGTKARGKSLSTSAASLVETTEGSDAARVTKHDRILALLSRRDGATIPELMEATSWQQHSVRGFLAGTVKTKLGMTLTSSKATGELRRYRIETRRGR